MKRLVFALIGLFINLSQAHAEITHWGYCTVFEEQNGCQLLHTKDPNAEPYCSCPGEPPKRKPIKIKCPTSLMPCLED